MDECQLNGIMIDLIDCAGCSALVCAPKHVAIGAAHEPGIGRQDSGAAQRPPNDAGRVELDIHGHHGHDRLEFAAQGRLPEALPPGSARGQPLPQLPLGREDSQVVRLLARLLAQITRHFTGSHHQQLSPFFVTISLFFQPILTFGYSGINIFSFYVKKIG